MPWRLRPLPAAGIALDSPVFEFVGTSRRRSTSTHRMRPGKAPRAALKMWRAAEYCGLAPAGQQSCDCLRRRRNADWRTRMPVCASVATGRCISCNMIIAAGIRSCDFNCPVREVGSFNVGTGAIPRARGSGARLAFGRQRAPVTPFHSTRLLSIPVCRRVLRAARSDVMTTAVAPITRCKSGQAHAGWLRG